MLLERVEYFKMRKIEGVNIPPPFSVSISLSLKRKSQVVRINFDILPIMSYVT